MKEVYSNEKDCRELRKILGKALGEKMEIYGVPYEVVTGYYHSFPFYSEGYFKDKLEFYYKYCNHEFLRIGVGDCISKSSDGHKLAALSDFCEALVEQFGEPTLFYTIKEDDEGMMNFQWCLQLSPEAREQEIQMFREGTSTADAEIDCLIIMGEDRSISEETRKLFLERMGLPFDMFPLIDKNVQDYIKYREVQERNTENQKESGYQKRISS